MDTNMEKLLHYVWQHRIYPAGRLYTQDGTEVDIIDPGLHNFHAGPDFFNAKVRLGDQLWVGNVEIHERASDWFRHKHEQDAAYNNVVLHIVSVADKQAVTLDGKTLPQLVLTIPDKISHNYEKLLHEDTFPPCYRIIPQLSSIKKHAWMAALTAERLEDKTNRLHGYLQQSCSDWERTFFIALARNFGFSVNSDAFEEWAGLIGPSAIRKHRDNIFQVEAFFFGQAGLLDNEAVTPERRDAYFCRLQKEFAFLKHKFSLSPMDFHHWKFLRLRPQNFPHVRLSQLVDLYYRQGVNFSRILETTDLNALRNLLRAEVTDYWRCHYSFGIESAESSKQLQNASLDLLIINTVAPLLFTYGKERFDENLCERAFDLLEKTRAEHNSITRSWIAAGLTVRNAADSQALIQLKREYCDKRDCIRCRFGAEYLRETSQNQTNI